MTFTLRDPVCLKLMTIKSKTMAYTVKQLATISNISVRTLHWYDEKELLEPAYIGENGYRYYEEPQLLRLQQILFYRELGFNLNDIKAMLSSQDFDICQALSEHKKTLLQDINHKQTLIVTIDKTIKHLNGEQTMKLEEIFEGFTEEKQNLYCDYLVDQVGVNPSVIEQCKAKTKNWTRDDWLAHKSACDKVHADLITAIREKQKPDTKEVQQLIQTHYELTCKFWTPDKIAYNGLAELYASHPDFVDFYYKLHPELLVFLQTAMQVYAEKNL